jgi:hypothetical protein
MLQNKSNQNTHVSGSASLMILSLVESVVDQSLHLSIWSKRTPQQDRKANKHPDQNGWEIKQTPHEDVKSNNIALRRRNQKIKKNKKKTSIYVKTIYLDYKAEENKMYRCDFKKWPKTTLFEGRKRKLSKKKGADSEKKGLRASTIKKQWCHIIYFNS